MQYTKDVHYKFTPDGQAMEFPGATIISFLPEIDPVLQSLFALQEKQASYAEKLTFLPPSSYHMTNKVLYNDHIQDRQGPGWSSKYTRNLSCREMDAALAKDLLRIARDHDKWPQSFRMRLWYVDNNSLKL